jgi:5-methylcytosine-specific restriction endonuclease McrA
MKFKKNIKFKRNAFNPKKLKVWAIKIKKLDGYKCVACGYGRVLHSHHILPKSKHKEYAYEIWNGITLCKICHLSDNGVHGSKGARNKTVSILRDLMNKDKKDVLAFKDSEQGLNIKKKLRPVKRLKSKKRSFYK